MVIERLAFLVSYFFVMTLHTSIIIILILQHTLMTIAFLFFFGLCSKGGIFRMVSCSIFSVME